MIYVKDYSNLFEGFGKTPPEKILFVISFGLRKLLERIISRTDNQVAIRFLEQHKRISNIISYIDRARDVGMVTYTRSSKVIDSIKEKGFDLTDEGIYNVKVAWIENREQTKIGRFVTKLLSKYKFTPKEIEEFVNLFKAESKKDTTGLDWKRVHGRDINYWYLKDRYVKGGGTLNRSCLRKSNRNSFVNFLSSNPKFCRLLILKNDQGKLLGRALMWRLPSGKIFMDRIYTRFDEDINLFIDTAKNMGWLYKSKQTYGGDIPLIDGKTGEETFVKMEIPDFVKRNFNGYPYMDTFQFYDIDKKILTNDESVFVEDGSVIKLNRVDGGYSSYTDDDVDETDMLE